VKHPQRLRAPTKAALAMVLLLAFGPSSWEQSRAADAAEEDAMQPAVCLDSTPHEVTFVTVEPGVKLEVLDFGGSGETMVLLTGYGDNAHIWDGFAYQFTDYFRVIGITRRGFGPSDKPDGGCDVRTRVRDDLKVLDHFGIRKAVFVGHSLAGSELSELGRAHPHRVDKLVYLDAYDLAERFRFPEDLPDVPYTDEDGRSLWILQAATARLEGFRRPDAAACNAFLFDPTGRIVGGVPPDEIAKKIADQIFASVKKQRPVNWRKIEAPRLGIFSPYALDDPLRWYWYLSADQKAQYDRAWPPIVKWSEDTIERFRSHDARNSAPIVWELPGATHYVYISDEAFVVRRMREFLLGRVED
jgi:pimeloyl-ACP methyl ester carboxylesterase